MIEKDKKYTYEELEKIYKEAQKVVLNKTTKELEKKEDSDNLTKLLFSIQNMLVMTDLYEVLFKGE